MDDTYTPGKKPHVVFYTRPGCHLCLEAKREMSRAKCERDYTFEEVNIETDPDLKRRYGWEIPVVTINGTVAFKHNLTARDFRQAVQSIADRGSRINNKSSM